MAQQVQHEPAVPTLYLTSDEDTIIPADVVQQYAAHLREAQPQRHVAVVRFAKGAHCQLHVAHPERFGDEIEALLAMASELL